MTFYSRKTAIVLSLSIVLLLSWITVSLAEGPKKVAILPFKINAAQDLTYLQEGIIDMLGSRLAWKGEVEILEKGLVREKVAEMGGPVDKEKAIAVGRALGADYVILGSLTVFGESVSIDAKILDVAKGEELITAFNQSKGMDEVIPTVNQFALDINEKIMGRVIQPRVAQVEEKKGPGALFSGEDTVEGGKPAHSQKFNVQMAGLDVGDVDGDGEKETVFIDEHSLYIYKWKDNAFRLFRKIKGPMGYYPIYVSLGDLDQNGVNEIYVSGLRGNSTDSFVVEWDGSDFKKIVDGQSWVFRVVEIPKQGPRLIGQKRNIDGNFIGKVYVLTRKKDRFVSTDEIKLNYRADVLNFTLIDLGAPGLYSVMFGPFDYLWLVDPDQKEVWLSDDYYGGTYNSIPVPIYITDIDKDGTSEVMIGKNHSATGHLTNLRFYNGGEVYFLTYDGVGLSMKYKTRKQPGPVVGYRLADVDNDGRNELIIASVMEQDLSVNTPRSRISVYDLHLK